MPRERKTRKEAGEARDAILEAALRALTRKPTIVLTVDAVAREAGCAKGLVHYHFKTKAALMAAAAQRLWTRRSDAWQQALAGPDPHAAISASWSLLAAEAATGTSAACAALGVEASELIGQTVRESREAFVRVLSDSLVGLLERMGRAASVPPSEIAGLLAAVIEGIGLQIAGGTRAGSLESAWAAFWAGILSLTRRA
jgi:AcrR family transcriptional regulator